MTETRTFNPRELEPVVLRTVYQLSSGVDATPYPLPPRTHRRIGSVAIR